MLWPDRTRYRLLVFFVPILPGARALGDSRTRHRDGRADGDHSAYRHACAYQRPDRGAPGGRAGSQRP